jgi:hypothetical protein
LDFYNNICQSRPNAPQQIGSLFDHLVSDGKQYRRHGEEKRLRGLLPFDQLHRRSHHAERQRKE